MAVLAVFISGLQQRRIIGKQFSIRDELKPIERRLTVLDEHIQQQADYYETHRHEFTLYEAADRYLKGVMNGKTTLPIKAWQAEIPTNSL